MILRLSNHDVGATLSNKMKRTSFPGRIDVYSPTLHAVLSQHCCSPRAAPTTVVMLDFSSSCCCFLSGVSDLPCLSVADNL